MPDLRTAMFFSTLAIELPRLQLLNFKNRVRRPLRILLAYICQLIAASFASIFVMLPTGWLNTVMANLISVPGAFLAFMLFTIGFAAFGMNELASKIKKTF